MNARGPAFEHYAQQLQEECNQVWWNGRHLCEASSMTGQPCVYPVRFFFSYIFVVLFVVGHKMLFISLFARERTLQFSSEIENIFYGIFI